ncbi:MAG: ABC transporter substrate-binding protein [Oscillospiraceae bacterium]|nr:ABC transporter substrate-binding protein [Oscillospiraceae bacterium]
MRKNRKAVALMFISALSLMLSACARQPAQTIEAPSATSAQTPQPAAAAAPRVLEIPDTVELVDMGGRAVTVPAPDKLERIYPDGATSLMLFYTLAPDKLTAAPSSGGSAFSDEQKKFVAPEVHDLPSYGTRSGQNGVLSLEEIKRADVQVILSMGVASVNENDISQADELQEQLDIPVLLFSGEMEDYAEAYRLLGKLIGREDDAERIIAYTADIVKTVEAVAAKVPADRRITLYYAQGDDGLATEPANSNRSWVFNTAGALNIATVEALGGFGQSAVSMEQVLGWNPQIIITQGTSNAYDTIMSDPNWATIDAVRNGRVYKMPAQPYSWADRPPSVNRFIGLHWMANLLYPELYDIDIVSVALDYYKVMYHANVSRQDMEAMLADATVKG